MSRPLLAAARPFRSIRLPALAVLTLGLVAASCNDSERVDLVFRAPPGTELEYEIAVESSVATDLAGQRDETSETILLHAGERVLPSSEAGEVRLEITIGRPERRPRVFEVRLEPRAGVARVDAVEGLAIEALGELGPSRLILLASGLLPERSLRPGATWDIERTVDLPEGDGLLTGQGRLSRLRREPGRGGEAIRSLAEVDVVTTLPARRTMTLPEGRVDLDGTERTEATLTYDVDDGTLYDVESVTTGRFALAVTPPEGDLRVPARGTLDIRVTSTTRRR